MPPESNNNLNIERVLDGIRLAIKDAFGSAATRLGKQTITTSVSILTTSTAVFPAINFFAAGNQNVRVFIDAANIIGSAPTTDRIRLDVLCDGVVVGRTYTGANNYSGRVLVAEFAVAAGNHQITCFGIKDVGTGGVTFYADSAGASASLVAELVK